MPLRTILIHNSLQLSSLLRSTTTTSLAKMTSAQTAAQPMKTKNLSTKISAQTLTLMLPKNMTLRTRAVAVGVAAMPKWPMPTMTQKMTKMKRKKTDPRKNPKLENR